MVLQNTYQFLSEPAARSSTSTVSPGVGQADPDPTLPSSHARKLLKCRRGFFEEKEEADGDYGVLSCPMQLRVGRNAVKEHEINLRPRLVKQVQVEDPNATKLSSFTTITRLNELITGLGNTEILDRETNSE